MGSTTYIKRKSGARLISMHNELITAASYSVVSYQVIPHYMTNETKPAGSASSLEMESSAVEPP